MSQRIADLVEMNGGSNENFKVAVRVRPPLARELNAERPFQNVVSVQDDRVLILSENLAAVNEAALKNDQGFSVGLNNFEGSVYSTHVFTFDHVYDQDDDQEVVYSHTARSAVLSVRFPRCRSTSPRFSAFLAYLGASAVGRRCAMLRCGAECVVGTRPRSRANCR